MEDFTLETHADEIREYARIAYRQDNKQLALEYMANHVETLYYYAKGLEFALKAIGQKETNKKD